MNVLLFCPAIGVNSGSGIRARLIVEGFLHWGATVNIVANAIPLDLIEQGVVCHAPLSGYGWQDTLLSAIAAEHPDIIYGITEAAADLVLTAGRQSGVPVAFDLHGIGFIEVLELGRGYGSRLERIRNSFRWLSAARKADIVTVANPTLLPLLRPFCRKVLSAFGMTDISHFNPKGTAMDWGDDPTRLKILYAGNHYRWQGIELLVTALLELGQSASDFQVLCLGNVGRDEAQVKAWQSGLPKGMLEFRESVDYHQVAAYYRGADAIVVPRPFMLSTYLAFPQKLVDGMASGRAIVATDLSPHRWALESPRSGLLCPSNSKGLALCLQRLKDQGLLYEIGCSARKRAEVDFCHLRQTKRVLRAFKDFA